MEQQILDEQVANRLIYTQQVHDCDEEKELRLGEIAEAQVAKSAA